MGFATWRFPQWLYPEGIRTTFGSPLFKDSVPLQDEPIVQRIRKAGAITLGKTNTPEFGAGSRTFNTVFGAAVALACRMLPIADGSDMGGSLRNPAAWSNVVGFRISPGRVPNATAAFAWSGPATAGPMAQTVSDVALFLSAIAGPHPASPLSLPEPGETFDRPLGRDFKGVRVAWFKTWAACRSTHASGRRWTGSGRCSRDWDV